MKPNPKALAFYGGILFCVLSWVLIFWAIKMLEKWLTS